jgi:hypothetical protein
MQAVQQKIEQNQTEKEHSMRLNHMITMCAVAVALTLSIGDAFAQINAGGGGGGGFGNGGGFGGGNGGGFGNGGGRRNRGGNGGNVDPAQMMQRQLDNYRQQLDITNDTEWSAIQPLVQKVLEAQQAARQGGRGGFGGGRRGGNNGPNGNGNANGGGRGGFGPQPSPEAQALQQAIDNDAPAAQLKDLLAKYNKSQKDKQAALATAQANLRQVLTVKQESQATLMGLLN